MLRLPQFSVESPTTLEGALALLSEHNGRALPIAGGTDLLPNLKHRLAEPELLVSLANVAELAGIVVEADGTLVIGAMTPLDTLAQHPAVVARAPALAQAAGIVASPQIRRMGTLGGNVMLDTRCRYINQTHFWRQALGFCLKKDGTVCHVVAGGKKCVAAASNDTAPALMSLGGELDFRSTRGARRAKIDELWKTDGIFNKKTDLDELLVNVRVPPQHPGHRGAYGKMRERGSFDFPQLGIAVRVDLDGGAVVDADVALVALQARPLHVKDVADTMRGTRPGEASFEDAARAVAARAFKQCHPMPNIPGDSDYRQEMVPVYVRRTLMAAVGLGERPLT
ncbi:MAG: FAD binding domain-containing protein [Myxococcales bacterium]|nr:FAD binding domain-containing protein [Myxococcales bacterium]